MDPQYCARCGHALQVREVRNDRVRPVCPACGYIVYLNPPIAVGVIAERSDGEILLVLRAENPGRGLWGLPAGFMEIDETAEETARRECLEETGVTVELDGLWGVWSYYHEPKQSSGVLILYAAHAVEGTPRAASDSLEARYFRPDEIPDNLLAFATHREALARWRNRPK
ncbi:MAG: NUDIX domain-containing protein [Chloroflexi bacterium]|nr:NUDIX domain-containing protein [Chloroflexota bacterium]MCL5951638.1 NUDIX domain-containing protein [Chloroflexota bacterium]